MTSLLLASLIACGSSSAEDATPATGSDAGADTDGDAKVVTPLGDAGVSEVGDSGDPALSNCVVGPSSDKLEVATTSGLVKGKETGNVFAFLGIPFAAPPVGPLRFKAPAPPACWTDVRPAVDFGNKCLQTKVVGSGTDGDEDCLTLNIWTPSLRTNEGKTFPVLMFMYGGANVIGASNQQILGNQYDGQKIADSQQAIVVTFNYRVGPFGFLTHPALSAENPHKVSGNYGLLDAIQALHWVRGNIAAFAGQPDHVLFFGESAGAFNTCALVSSPLAKGLFSAALMESGVCDAPTMEYRYTMGGDVAKAVKCDTATDVAACLRAANVDELVKTAPLDLSPAAVPIDFKHVSDLSFGANVDGYVLPDAPIHTIELGLQNPVPMVIGSNAHEAELFVQQGSFLTCADVSTRLDINFSNDKKRTDKVAELYPCSFLNPRRSFVDGVTDMVFTCPARRAARAVAKSNKVAAYRYVFNHTYQLGPETVLRAYHTAELPFVFGTFSSIGYTPTPAESALSKSIQSYWATFAKTGNPTAAGEPLWEAYDTKRDNTLILDATLLGEEITMQDGVQSERCDFWDSLVAP